MNVSATFQELKKKQYELTQRERLMVLGAIGLSVMTVFFYTTSDVDVGVSPNPPITNAQGVKGLNQTETPVIQTDQIMRDPFAEPPQLNTQQTEIAPPMAPIIPNGAPRNIPGSVPRSVIPTIPYGNLKLTGIAGNADQHLAVIKSANKSKTYSVNEFIGADKIIAITNDYVVLANGDQKSVLHLEQAGQKGGNYSEN